MWININAQPTSLMSGNVRKHTDNCVSFDFLSTVTGQSALSGVMVPDKLKQYVITKHIEHQDKVVEVSDYFQVCLI